MRTDTNRLHSLYTDDDVTIMVDTIIRSKKYHCLEYWRFDLLFIRKFMGRKPRLVCTYSFRFRIGHVSNTPGWIFSNNNLQFDGLIGISIFLRRLDQQMGLAECRFRKPLPWNPCLVKAGGYFYKRYRSITVLAQIIYCLRHLLCICRYALRLISGIIYAIFYCFVFFYVPKLVCNPNSTLYSSIKSVGTDCTLERIKSSPRSSFEKWLPSCRHVDVQEYPDASSFS